MVGLNIHKLNEMHNSLAYDQTENLHNSMKSTLAISHMNVSGTEAIKSSYS